MTKLKVSGSLILSSVTQYLSLVAFMLGIRNMLLGLNYLPLLILTFVLGIVSLKLDPSRMDHVDMRVELSQYYKRPRQYSAILVCAAQIISVVVILCNASWVTDLILNPEETYTWITGAWQYASNAMLLRKYAAVTGETVESSVIKLSYIKDIYYANLGLVWILLHMIIQENRLANLLQIRERMKLK